MVPAAVKIAICQNRWLAMFTAADYSNSKSDARSRAYILEIQIVESYASDDHLLSQTRKAFTSVSLLIPALFAPSVAKKPHIPLNARPSASADCQPSCAAFRHYIGGEPLSGDINDIQGHR